MDKVDFAAKYPENCPISEPSKTSAKGKVSVKINNIFKRAILSLLRPSLFGSSNERRVRDQKQLNYLKGTGGEELKLKTPDGRNLEAMYFANESSSKTVILFTGSHDSFEHQATPIVNEYKKLGYNVLCLSYGGFGKSEGVPSQQNIELDAETAYQYIKKITPENEILAHGYSLGSYPATHLAHKHNETRVVVDRGFSTLSKVTKDVATDVAGKGIGILLYHMTNYTAPFDNTKNVVNIPGERILFARAEGDETMEAYHQKKFENIKPNARYLEVSGSHEHTLDEVWLQNSPRFKDWVNPPPPEPPH